MRRRVDESNWTRDNEKIRKFEEAKNVSKKNGGEGGTREELE